MKFLNKISKDAYVSFGKHLLLSIIVFGGIWVLSSFLDGLIGTKISFVINIIMNITAIVLLGRFNKKHLLKKRIAMLNKSHCEFILSPIETIINIQELESSPELISHSVDLTATLLGHLADRIEIVMNNIGYENNIDFFYLMKRANELYSTSPTFNQDINDFRKLIEETFS